MSSEQQITVYGKAKSTSIFKLVSQVFMGFYGGFGLGYQLAKRDIKAQYRQSFLGIGWALVTPAASALLWMFLGNSKVLNIANTNSPYPLFVLTGIILWQTFLESLNSPIVMFNSNKNVLKKININKESLIIGGFLKVLFNLSIKFVILIPLMLFYEVYPGFNFLIGLFGILVMIVFGFVIGIWLTPIGALYTDVQRFIMSISQLLFFLTPIIYAKRVGGYVGLLDRFNPLSISICGTREMLLGTMDVIWSDYFVFVGLVAIIGLIGLSIYRISLPIIVERMGS